MRSSSSDTDYRISLVLVKGTVESFGRACPRGLEAVPDGNGRGRSIDPGVSIRREELIPAPSMSGDEGRGSVDGAWRYFSLSTKNEASARRMALRARLIRIRAASSVQPTISAVSS